MIRTICVVGENSRHHVTFDDEALWARLVAAGNVIDADTATPSITEANWNADQQEPEADNG